MSGNGLTYNEFNNNILPNTNITALSGNNATSSDSAPFIMKGGRRRRCKTCKKVLGGRKNKSKKEEKLNMNMNMMMQIGGDDAVPEIPLPDIQVPEMPVPEIQVTEVPVIEGGKKTKKKSRRKRKNKKSKK